jgi:hypothetical protein
VEESLGLFSLAVSLLCGGSAISRCCSDMFRVLRCRGGDYFGMSVEEKT